jgi:uncharacterized protein
MLRPLLAVALLAGPAAAQDDACTPDRLDLRSGGSTFRFEVGLADDAAERAQGLMHRESLDRFAGMLFVYETPQPVGFWMENTLIPLDMLFFDEAGRLTRVHERAEPLSRAVIHGGDAVRYVLELNGGLIEELGIEPGAEIRHSAVAQDVAAWPCPGGG